MNSRNKVSLSRTALRKARAQFASWRRRSLVVCTISRVALIGIGLAILFAYAGMLVVQGRESQRIVKQVSNLVSTVEAPVRVACFTGDQTLAKEVSSGLMSNRSVASVRINSGKSVLAEAGHYAGKDFPKEGVVIRQAIFSPFNETDKVGEIELLVDDAFIDEQASSYSVFVASASMLEMLAIMAAVGWVVLRTVVRPIEEFSGKLRKVSIEEGGRLLPPKGSEFNELGHLVYVFNNLLDGQRDMLLLEQGLRAELVRNEKRFRALAENSPNLLVRYDSTLRRTYCNPAYDALLGLRSGIATGRRPDEFWLISNMSAQDYQVILRRVMDFGLAEHVMLEWVGPNGHYLINDFHLVPEMDEGGQIVSVLAIGHDVSALKAQQRADRDRVLVFERIVQSGDLPVVLEMVANHVERMVRVYRCAILLQEEVGGRLQLAAAPGMPDDLRQSVQEYVTPYEEMGSKAYWRGFGEMARHCGMSIARHERIYDSDHNLLGQLVLYHELGNVAAAIDMDLVRQACSLVAIAVERKRSEELIQHQASYDALTDLPNRRMFVDHLRAEVARAQRDASNVALLFIDLDRFKGVNDTLGHEVGDQLLIAAALRIRQCVRASDLVARLGGDEFVVLIPEVAEVAHLGRLAQEITAVLCEPFELGAHTAYVSASVGIASYPADAESPDKLVSCADQAMYAAKESGRNGFHFYSAELSASANERLAIEMDLRQALRRDELELYFQPKMDLLDGSLVGAEALLRWNHPERGLVMPDKFITVAEDCGLIVEMGEWVLREACRTVAGWNAVGSPVRRLAINLSARQFQAPHLFEQVSLILEECHCRPEWIELEITESLLLEEGGEVLETLRAFRRAGISIAIDDFGTGYSALSYLARFPINTLKIDRSFIRHVTNDGYHVEVVKAILSIANSLGQQVVAEGVETEEQAAYLRALGCPLVQGYLYGKPMPVSAFEMRFLPLRQDKAEEVA
jgi:diguanylate cyclase (GGDEF)-like protein/PAS domain S-box-containing protein